VKQLFIVPLMLMAAACAGRTPPPKAEPVVVTQIVKVPIAAPCVPKTLGAAPQYIDTKEKLKAAADAAERLQLLYGGRAQREARLNELEPVVAGCPRG